METRQTPKTCHKLKDFQPLSHFSLPFGCPRSSQSRTSVNRRDAKGFPPLYIDPIDFAALYRKRVSESPATAPVPAS